MVTTKHHIGGGGGGRGHSIDNYKNLYLFPILKVEGVELVGFKNTLNPPGIVPR